MRARLLLFSRFFAIAGCGLLLLAGCGDRQSPGQAASSEPSAKAPPAASAQAEPIKQANLAQSTAEALPKDTTASPAATYRWPPDFQLPLQIQVDAPEPPPEITRPSPPITEGSAPRQEKKEPVGQEGSLNGHKP